MAPVRDTVKGCILGGAIGDAAGASSEGLASAAATSWRQANWSLTDDTQLTLATCEALLELSPQPQVIAESLLRWFRERRLVSLGASTLSALRGLNAGGHWALVGRAGEGAAGNGAAMRIAPLAFCTDPFTNDGRRLIRDVCRITHRNEEAYIGALAVVMAIQRAAQGRFSLDGVVAHLPDSLVRDGLIRYVNLKGQPRSLHAGQEFGVSGFVAESIPFALFAADAVAELGFTEMLNQVIMAGGDTDTNASIAGQVAGARLGFSRLPDDLLARLPEIDSVLRTASHFADSVEARGVPFEFPHAT